MNGVHRIPRWIWPITAALLVMATFDLPYGYYTLLRIVVCAFAVAVFACAWDGATPKRIWPLIFVGVAIVFNPLIPIHLERATWFFLDVGAAVLIVAHLATVRLRPEPSRA